jgi:hypothetical protein
MHQRCQGGRVCVWHDGFVPWMWKLAIEITNMSRYITAYGVTGIWRG